MLKKNKQSTTMEDHGEVKRGFIDETDYEVSLILLELSKPVVFSSDSPFLRKWGRTKKRSTSVFRNPRKISPEQGIKSPPSTVAGKMGSTSNSSCLTDEAKKTNPQSIKKGFEEEFSTKNQRLKPEISSQVPILETKKTGLVTAQVEILAHPIAKKRKIDSQNVRHIQPLINPNLTANVKDVKTASLLGHVNVEPRGCNLPLPTEEEGNRIAAMINFQRMAAKTQVAAQARQRRLGLIRSKKLSSRFISPYQIK